MSPTSEIFPNAPLALVAMEVRFPAGAVNGALSLPVFRTIRDFLGDGWVAENGHQQLVEFAVGPAVGPPKITSEEVTRLTVRDRTKAVTVRAQSLTVEATSYNGYAEFRSLLAKSFEAVEKVLAPDGISRLGLRYIDEIRVPAETVNWADWIDPSMLAPRTDTLEPVGWAAAVQYDLAPERRLVLRYGPAASAAVDPGGPLKRPKRVPAGPLFVLDFDSFWEPDGIPAFTAPDLLTACDELRAPVRDLFDQMVTPQLADVFRNEASA